MDRDRRSGASDGCGRGEYYHALRFSRSRMSGRMRGQGSTGLYLALLGAGPHLPKSELPKDYTNYGGNYEQYPIDAARFKRVAQLAAEKGGLGQTKKWERFGWASRGIAAF